MLALQEFDLLNQRGRLRDIGVRRSKIKGLGTEFESLREYGLGDDYRKIDWKATARSAKFMVRQYEVERNQSVIIAIDAGRHMLGEVEGVTKLDCALDASLMLSKAALSNGDHVGLLLFRERVLQFMPPKRANNQIGSLISALHDLMPYPVESDYLKAFSYLSQRWKRRSLIIIFTDASEPERAKTLSVGLGGLVRNNIVVVIQVNDPQLRELLENPLEEIDDLYRRASGLFIDGERTEALAYLKARKLQVVSSEPQDLPRELVSFYYQVKERALI